MIGHKHYSAEKEARRETAAEEEGGEERANTGWGDREKIKDRGGKKEGRREQR